LRAFSTRRLCGCTGITGSAPEPNSPAADDAEAMRAASDEKVLTLSASGAADDVAARINALLKAGGARAHILQHPATLRRSYHTAETSPARSSGDGVPSRRATLQRPRYIQASKCTQAGRDPEVQLRQTQIIDVGAASLECTVNGSGDPLVVLANAGCSTRYLESFGDRIAGSQIIAINMRGVGAARAAGQRDPSRSCLGCCRSSGGAPVAAPFTSWVTPSVTGSPLLGG